jgi:16S rRNA (adenine1518-N6/adenine1519-N6)-dimethyltransferase
LPCNLFTDFCEQVARFSAAPFWPRMNLSQIRAVLEEARVRPVKTLGQNFLHDRNLSRWIVTQAEVKADDFVLEIGPGLGALTEEILSRGARLIAIEKDARLIEFLRQKFRDSRFEVRHGDALKFDTRVLFAERNVKLLGNLPYYIASQLLVRFVDYPSAISLALLMLQNEMARRITANPTSADYGALSLRMQLHHRIEYLRKIPNTVFFPEPEVASAVVRITPRSPTEVDVFDPAMFQRIVRLGFSQRRKQLRKLLSDCVGDWKIAAEKIGVLPSARAEELSLDQWIALANFITPSDEKAVAVLPEERFPVVDKHDRKIGEARRSEVHENNLRHRAIHVLIFNQKGELLLQKRSPWKDRHPSLWDSSAAGHVSVDEEYDAAARRELAEELGVETKLNRVAKIQASERTGEEFIWLYSGESEGPFHFPRMEIDAVQFFPIEVVDKWNAQKPEEFAPGFRECWAIWREKSLGKTQKYSRSPEAINGAPPNPAAGDSRPAI